MTTSVGCISRMDIISRNHIQEMGLIEVISKYLISRQSCHLSEGPDVEMVRGRAEVLRSDIKNEISELVGPKTSQEVDPAFGSIIKDHYKEGNYIE